MPSDSKEIKIRRSWKINPRVRVKENLKVYSRKRNKQWWQREIKKGLTVSTNKC